MSESPESSTSSPSTSSPSAAASTAAAVTPSALVTTQGRTSIADGVVAKIAGLAAKEVNGVHALGGGAARAIGSLRERIPGSRTNHTQGVAVEVGEREAAVDIALIAEYGVAIADLATGVRRNVIASVERMTGLSVKEVNIDVNDVHLPEDDEAAGADPEPQPSRVR